MTEEENTNSEISRRNFVKGATAGAALVAGGALLGGTPITANALTKSAGQTNGDTSVVEAQAASCPPVGVPTSWSKTTDVVVVGYGGAGAVTAISAFDAGAEVLVLEKSPSLASLGITGTTPAYMISGGGGNTHMSAGGAIWPSDPVLGATHLYAISWGATPMDICQAWGQVASQLPAWYKAMGIPYTVSLNVAEFPTLPGASCINSLGVAGNGQKLFYYMDQQVQSRGIQILFNTAGTDLIQDPKTKEILGVRALSNYSEVLNIQAKRGVVLCTGGFEYNDSMKLNYLKAYPYHFLGWPYNTGDGIKMAQGVGADLWHMNATSAFMRQYYPSLSPCSLYVGATGYGYIWVNKYGQRFYNEILGATFTHTWNYALADFDLTGPGYDRIPTFLIFDETTRLKGPIMNQTAFSCTVLPPQFGGIPAWSKDNSAEIAKGYILKGQSSIADLVNTINQFPWTVNSPNDWQADRVAAPAVDMVVSMDPAKLAATVNQWNADCAAGKGDTAFGRTAAQMAPISTPPFYAVAMWPGGPNTQGGPVRDARARILDTKGKPIPRLYGNGECGSIWGFLYAGSGGDISELISFGQIAGNNVAQETPWTS